MLTHTPSSELIGTSPPTTATRISTQLKSQCEWRPRMDIGTVRGAIAQKGCCGPPKVSWRGFGAEDEPPFEAQMWGANAAQRTGARGADEDHF